MAYKSGVTNYLEKMGDDPPSTLYSLEILYLLISGCWKGVRIPRSIGHTAYVDDLKMLVTLGQSLISMVLGITLGLPPSSHNLVPPKTMQI